MNQHLQSIFTTIQQDENLSAEQKAAISKSLKDADKELEIVSFKLDRTEKVKRTTAILLEETIEELEQKRKAVEAQNRELEIETSLERVRSRALAMHKSEELKDVAIELRRQLGLLGQKELETSAIHLYDESPDYLQSWAALLSPNGQGEVIQTSFQFPKRGVRIIEEVLECYALNKQDYVLINEGAKANEFLEMLSQYAPEAFKVVSKSMSGLAPEDIKAYWSMADFAGGSLVMTTMVEPDGVSRTLLRKFANVFGLAYRRFVDLKLAEAQTREAKIETALETVRSSSLAMHKSDELKNVVKVVFKKLQELDFTIDGAALIMTNGIEENFMNTWIGDDHAEYPECFKIPYYDAPTITDIWDAKKAGVEFTSKTYSFKEKNIWFEYAFKNTELATALPDQLKSWILEQEYLTQTFAIAKNSAIGIHFHYKKELTANEIDILKRFSRVFEQAYTRFLDLQKAETQAREAEIQLALERVRARTMAMQKSDELAEAARLLYQQFHSLGIKTYTCAYMFIEEEKNQQYGWAVASDGTLLPDFFDFPLMGDLILDQRFQSWKDRHPIHEAEIHGEANKRHHAFLVSMQPPEFAEYIVAHLPDQVFFYSANFLYGYLFIVNTVSFTQEEKNIAIRFANVFEQTYTRFLDLQKAEAQAREAKIEAALERVRASSMAMHDSGELEKVVKTLSDKLIDLGLSLDGALIFFFEKEKRRFYLWIATNHLLAPIKVDMPYDEGIQNNLIIKNLWEAIETESDFMNESYSGKVKDDYFRFVAKYNESKIPESIRNFQLEAESWTVSLAGGKHSVVGIDSWSGKIITPENFQVLKRFSHVFEQAYTRFLDLQKAEAQAREAQIENALEKVRSRSLAMHQSVELKDVIVLVFEKLRELEVTMDSASILTFNKDAKGHTVWAANRGLFPVTTTYVPYFEDPINKAIYDVRESEKDFIDETWTFEEKNSRYEYLFEHTDWKYFNDDLKQAILSFEGLGYTGPILKHSATLLVSYSQKTYSEHEKEIVKRFGKVFEQAYIRFLDLQKAEAQALEAKIEAAFERVRSRTMAMQKSDELQDAAMLLFQQVEALGMPPFACGFNIWDDDRKAATAWMGSIGGLQPPFKTDSSRDVFMPIYEAAQRGESLFVIEQSGKKLEVHYQYMATIPTFRDIILEDWKRAGVSVPTFQIIHCAYFAQGYLMFISFEPVSAYYDIFKRFAKVFEQTYTRFLDLQKAEAQTRESQIQLALERVRARTMAMQKSDELSDVAGLLFNQVSDLGIKTWTTGFNVWSVDNNSYVDYITSPLGGFIKPYTVVTSRTEVLTDLSNARKSGVEFSVLYAEGEKLRQTYLELIKFGDEKQYDKMLEDGTQFPSHQYNHFVFGSKVSLMFITYEPVPEVHDIFKRFGKVFEQTYTRFLDLKKAEAQAHEAVKQASLDRVRGEIASMRTKDDLNRITPLIWKELTALGVSFIRCGVFIMDETREMIQTYLSTPNGDSLTAFELSFDAEGISAGAVKHWRKNEIYQDFWDKKQFVSFMQNLIQEGKVDKPETYQGSSVPPDKLYLNFVPFKQGMLYVGNIAPLTNEDLQPAKSLAEAFAMAYARYEDFNQLEKAKNQVEQTLTELKSAQTQLIQSEKMASLGELTAGIAHEIQNPLNFVNNFSEVSGELLTEMDSELEKGDIEEAKAIAADVRLNLEKINHHGKRAADIVKGMLQHSRTSSGQKEPTDINILCDEYLRLSYHGLRAKDKSFNCDYKTEFDEALPKINVIPQDIGRVLLNLINNAFYAVQVETRHALSLQQTPQKQPDYSPTVIVSTKNRTSHVEIRVKDNGFGIPAEIKDKIFQPFFTTKPTGQGTGLGLSLSYDIVKAHGGELKVETNVGEGSEFIIQLPV